MKILIIAENREYCFSCMTFILNSRSDKKYRKLWSLLIISKCLIAVCTFFKISYFTKNKLGYLKYLFKICQTCGDHFGFGLVLMNRITLIMFKHSK